MEKTCYKILYQKKQDLSGYWYTKKGYYETQVQAEKYISILEQVSDIYSVLRVEPFVIVVPDPVQKQPKRAAKKANTRRQK